MKVWIFQTGEPLQIDAGALRPMRAMNLSNALIEQGHEVVLWSSDFDHFSKTHRFKKEKNIQYSKNLNIKLIPSRGYKSNIGISRLIDHIDLALNLKKMLKKQPPPDVAFIGYPPIEATWVIASWLKKQNIPFLIDVKDAWPEIFIKAFPLTFQKIARIAFIPLFLIMRKTFKMANGISSPTQDFLNWSLENINRNQNTYDRITRITLVETEIYKDSLTKAEIWLDQLGIKIDGTFRICFVGTLNYSYNFAPVIRAARLLPVEFVIAGDGPLYKNLKKDTEGLLNFKLLGQIDSVQANLLYARSNLVIAPYRDSFDFQLNITNKFYDAMAKGKPVITSLSGAIAKLFDQFEIGFKYDESRVENLMEILTHLVADTERLSKAGNNARNLFVKEFSGEQIYSELVSDLIKLAKHD